MSEPFSLQKGDIIRHKNYPKGPEWRIVRAFPNLCGGMTYRLASTTGELWGIAASEPYELYPLGKTPRLWASDIEAWAMKRVRPFA